MVTKAQARVRLGVDKTELDKGLKDAKSSLDKWAIGMSAQLAVAEAGWDAISGAVGAAASAIADWVRIASEQEKQEQRLITIARQRGTFTRQHLEWLNRLNAARQQALGISDDEQLRLQTQLSLMGVSNEQLDEATRYTIGLAEVTGSYDSAAKLVVRTLNGQFSALKEYGIQVKSVAEAKREFGKLLEVAEANANTLSTRLNVLNENLGEFQEALGTAIIKSKSISSEIDVMSLAIANLTTAIGDNQPVLTSWIDNGLVKLVNTLSNAGALQGFGPLGSLLQGLQQFRGGVRQLAGAQFGELSPDTFVGPPLLGAGGGDTGEKKPKPKLKSEGIPQPSGAIGRSSFFDADPTEFFGILGALTSDELRTLAKEATELIEETRSEFEAIQDRWLAEQRSAFIDGLETQKDFLDARKAIIDDELLTEGQRVEQLALIRKREEELERQAYEQKRAIGELVGQTVGQSINAAISQAIAGEATFGTIIRGIFATALESIGSYLQAQAVIYTGIAFATQGSTAKEAIAFGLGAKAAFAGAALLRASRGSIAANGVTGGGAGVGAPSLSSAVPTRVVRPSTSTAFQEPLRTDNRPIVYNINFHQPVGDPRATARYLANFLERNLGPLQPAGSR